MEYRKFNRSKAASFIIPPYSRVYKSLLPFTEKKPTADAAWRNLTKDYLRSANETVRKRSTETAVAFLYLPEPPRSSGGSGGAEAEAEAYLDSLATLTADWPPTLLVRGVSPVMSTTL